jgi:hypothetical protein
MRVPRGVPVVGGLEMFADELFGEVEVEQRLELTLERGKRCVNHHHICKKKK